jgi:hypothetical protein
LVTDFPPAYLRAKGQTKQKSPPRSSLSRRTCIGAGLSKNAPPHIAQFRTFSPFNRLNLSMV